MEQEKSAKILKPPIRFVNIVTIYMKRAAVGATKLLVIVYLSRSLYTILALIIHSFQSGTRIVISIFSLNRHVLTFDVILVDSTSSALAKLKGVSGVGKTPQAEKKETPQERLKRIMSKQLNKQSNISFLSALVMLRSGNHVSSYVLCTEAFVCLYS